MELLCRGCLKTVDDLADLLQYTEESRRLFIYSTGLQVKRNDQFPFQLCKECYYSMKTLCKFKKICRTSDKQIKSFLALKDVDDGLDFNTFLKRHEESLTFRLPLLTEDSASAKQKIKDDDNESTCTSIQNFMTDLLRADEIPDSEARIIREVIEEEADVLEDSLDSHWLQDDNSMESDIELNFSLKQFLTPHSTNNDHLYSSDYREVTSNDITSVEDYDNIQIENTFQEISNPVDSSYLTENDTIPIESALQENTDPVDSSYVIERDTIPIDSTLQEGLDQVDSTYVVENDNEPIDTHSQKIADPVDTPYVIEDDTTPVENTSKKVPDPVENTYVVQNMCDIDIESGVNNSSCAIDINLEKALMDENNQEIPLEEILASPSVFIKTSSPPPLIKRNLRRDKVNIKKKKSSDFDSDLDLLMGKLINDKSNGGELLEEKMDLENLILDKVEASKNGLGKSVKKKSKLLSSKNVGKSGKSNVDKSQKGISKKDQFTIDELLDAKTSLENLNVINLTNEELDLGVLDVGKIQKGNLDSEVLNIGKLQDPKSDLGNINIGILQGNNSDTANLAQWFDNNVDAESLEIENEANIENDDDDQEDNSLEEFLIVNKEELEDIIKEEEDLNNSDCEVRMDDAEVTEIPQDNCDENAQLDKDKKSLSNKSLKKDNSLSRQSKSSSIDKKYCITNFYCKMCNKKFKNLAALKVHFARYHQCQIIIPKSPRPVNIKVCEMCSRTFTNTKSLLRHLASHKNPQEYSCERCTLTFRSENALNTHKAIHMKTQIKPKDSNSRFVCKICGAISTSSSNHLTHQRRHSKSYTLHCDECGRGFYRTTELVVHMRQHTGEKPFMCLYCDRSFSRRDCLNRHMKCHTEEKPFDCQYCGRTFAKRYDIKVHQSYNKYCLKIREKLLVQSKEV